MVALFTNSHVVKFDHHGRSSRVFSVHHRTVSGCYRRLRVLRSRTFP
jgi:hypothetical protein